MLSGATPAGRDYEIDFVCPFAFCEASTICKITSGKFEWKEQENYDK